jgi:hypothetical protein
MLNEKCALGKRFHAIYNAEGDETANTAQDDPSLSVFLSKVHADWAERKNNDTIFTIFGAENHKNMEVFHRYQDLGACFIHGPCLHHFYKTLWDHPTLPADKVKFFHVSKYARHAFSGAEQYDLIVLDKGGYQEQIAKQLFGPTCKVMEIDQSDWNSDVVRSKLEEHGPLLLSLLLHKEIYSKNDLSHREIPTTAQEDEGHGMVVIGVRDERSDAERKDVRKPVGEDELRPFCEQQRRKTVVLLQNFWKNHEFLEMDLQYLKKSGGKLYYIDGKIDVKALSYEGCKEEAGKIRYSHCSSPVDKAARPLRLRTSQKRL